MFIPKTDATDLMFIHESGTRTYILYKYNSIYSRMMKLIMSPPESFQSRVFLRERL
jgi:hypothetical protein